MFCMEMSSVNLDYKNIFISESMKMVGKRQMTDRIKDERSPDLAQDPGNSPKNKIRHMLFILDGMN